MTKILNEVIKNVLIYYDFYFYVYEYIIMLLDGKSDLNFSFYRSDILSNWYLL